MELSTGRPATLAPRGMVTCPHSLASSAGVDALRAGGSAVDAAIAAEMVLGLVEPQSSGIGGGGFMLVYDAESERIGAYDGRERAPAGATPTMFLDARGRPMNALDAIASGRSTEISTSSAGESSPSTAPNSSRSTCRWRL